MNEQRLFAIACKLATWARSDGDAVELAEALAEFDIYANERQCVPLFDADDAYSMPEKI